MRFWEDFTCKYGFNDGVSYPDGVEKYREVYVKAINKLAEKHGSNYRVKAYDRPGFHNFYLIVQTDKDGNETKTVDNAFTKAIEEAYKVDLDDLIEVEVKIADDFEDFLSTL